MPSGVYPRKPRDGQATKAIVVLPKRRGPNKSTAQAYQMLRAASAQLHALAINIEIASQILAGGKDND